MCVLYFSIISDIDNIIGQKGSKERAYGKESKSAKKTC